MEENKKNNSERASARQGQKKATYEDLNNYCVQLLEQNKQLAARLRQTDLSNLFKRLDYLFMVLGSKDCFDTEFVLQCADEIKRAMSVPSEEEQAGEGGKKENTEEQPR